MQQALSVLALCCLVSLPALAQPGPEPDLCAVPPGAQPSLPARLLEGMGRTDMPVTTRSDEARKFFNQGISQMHSFWFVESERSFLQAATLDPEMAMAYWGMALSANGNYRPAFQLLRNPDEGGRIPAPEAEKPEAIVRSANGAALNPQIRAREAIARAMELKSKVTERERLYIEALAARLDRTAKSSDAAYIEGLRKLVAAYPDDLEAKSMLGLATLNGFDPVTKDPREGTLDAIRLLEEVAAKDDNHFGAHHYIIHGYEGSRMPEKAWHACKRYTGLVPNIPHALHMPGHIYAQSDKIDEAIAAFTSAAENELRYLAADVLYSNGHHGHNVHFLIHTLNLDGRFEESMKWARHLLEFKETPRERRGANQRVTYRQGFYALVKTLVRFEKWDLILDEVTIPQYDRPEQEIWRHWAIALAHAARGDLTKARAAEASLDSALKALDSARAPLQIAAQEVKATIAVRSGDSKKGYDLFRRAAAREAALLYTEPPSYPRPLVEGMAHVALAVGDYGVAEQAYREALAREPGSGRAYFGLAEALQALDRKDEARSARDRAAQAWNKADRGIKQQAVGSRP